MRTDSNKAYLFRKGYLYLYLVSLVIILWNAAVHGWIHPEVQTIDRYVLNSHDSIIKQILNWKELEFAPRQTRVVSSIFQVVEGHWRGIRFLDPLVFRFRTVSILWILPLYVNPWLFSKIAKLFTTKKYSQYIAFYLYLFSINNLSSMLLYFRPAKVLATFGILLCLFIYFTDEENNSPSFSRPISYVLLYTFTLLCDETGYMVILLVGLHLVLFNHSLRKFYTQIILLSCTIAILTSLYMLPFLASLMGIRYETLNNYFIISDLFTGTTQHWYGILNLLAEILLNYFYNSKAAVAHVFGLVFLGTPIGELLLYTIVMVLVFLVMRISIVDKSYFNKEIVNITKKDCARYLVLSLLLGILFHTILLTVVRNKVWGTFYYGSPISITALLLIVYLCDNLSIVLGIQVIPKIKHLGIICLCTLTLLSALSVSEYLKEFHYYHKPDFTYREVFSMSQSLGKYISRRQSLPQESYKRAKAASNIPNMSCLNVRNEDLWFVTRSKIINGYGFDPLMEQVKQCNEK